MKIGKQHRSKDGSTLLLSNWSEIQYSAFPHPKSYWNPSLSKKLKEFLAPLEQTFCVTVLIIFKLNRLFSPWTNFCVTAMIIFILNRLFSHFPWFPHIYLLFFPCSLPVIFPDFLELLRVFSVSLFLRPKNSPCGWPGSRGKLGSSTGAKLDPHFNFIVGSSRNSIDSAFPVEILHLIKN